MGEEKGAGPRLSVYAHAFPPAQPPLLAPSNLVCLALNVSFVLGDLCSNPFSHSALLLGRNKAVLELLFNLRNSCRCLPQF